MANALPAGAMDCHAHILGPFDRYPLSPTRGYMPPLGLLSDYRALLDSLGIERSVIVQASVYGYDNACTLDAIRDLGPGACGIAAVAPDASAEALSGLKASGIVGLRLNHAQTGAATPLSIQPYLAMAREHRLHLQLFQMPPAWPSLLPVLVDSGVDWVVDHLGMVPAREGLRDNGFKAILRALRVGGWVKLSAFYRISADDGYRDVRPMVEALVDAAPDRCLFGTDWPHTDTSAAPDAAVPLRLLSEWLTPEQFERVLVHNPTRLYHRG